MAVRLYLNADLNSIGNLKIALLMRYFTFNCSRVKVELVLNYKQALLWRDITISLNLEHERTFIKDIKYRVLRMTNLLILEQFSSK